MRHVRIAGITLGLGDYDYYRLIGKSLASLREIAEGLAGQQRLGVPDILGTLWRAPLMQGLTDLDEFRRHHFDLDDGELREKFDLLFESLHRLSEADEQMVKWLARWAHISSVRLVPSRRRLYQKVTRQAEKRMLAGALPEWVADPIFQSFLSQSEQAATRIADTTKLIDQRLPQILGVPYDAQITAPSKMEMSPLADLQDQVGPSIQPVQGPHGEAWDQRAKDLVDESLGLEPLEAIPLLRKALRYGRTGVQASRAYLVLGMKYEGMGDDKRAVQAYTKSIEAWQPDAPSPIALFWRGQIHYRNGRLRNARSDLELALKNGLTSPEREQAERYLEEIGERGVQ